MTPFDYAVIAVLLGSLLLGFWRGVVGEVLVLAGWILAFIVARQFGDTLADSFLVSITDPTLRHLAGWALAFIGVLIAISLVRVLFRGVLRAAGLGTLDRFLGVFFGLARGGLVVLLIVAAAGMTPLPNHPWWKQATFSPYLEQAVLASAPWLPDEVNNRIRFN